MSKYRIIAAFAFAATGLAPAAGANLTIVKSTTIVSDQVNGLNPKALPGATIDYSLMVTNPIGNIGSPVAQVVITEPIPADVMLRVDDINGSSGGPVEYKDGILGLLASGLTYNYTALTSTTDKLEFFNGTTWTYQPTSTGGYDANVRAIRVTLTGTHATGGTFQLRYRVQVK